MNGSGGDIASVALGLLLSNLVYLLLSVMFFEFLGVAYSDIAAGPFAKSLSTLVRSWIAVGVLLGVIDFLAVVSVFTSSVSGGRGW